MAKKIAVVFAVTMVVLLSIETTLAQDESSTENILSQLNLEDAASQVQEAMSSLSTSEDSEGESTPNSGSWTDWFKTKMENAGILPGSAPAGAPLSSQAGSPVSAPAQAPGYQVPRAQGPGAQAPSY